MTNYFEVPVGDPQEYHGSTCQRCGSNRILSVGAKCSDCCAVEFKGFEHDGYVPKGIGIGEGDTIEIDVCLECGQLQDQWPKPDPEFYVDEGNRPSETGLDLERTRDGFSEG
jgi:hypothetical protein